MFNATKPPFSYEQLNLANSFCSPSTVHVSNTELAAFFRRYLMQDAQSVYKFNLPDNWSESYFLNSLYSYGYIAVINTDAFGVIPQFCGLSGFNVFYEPTNVVISNPLISKTVNAVIGQNTELIRFQPDFGGVPDLISYYADQMAIAAETAGINMFNSRLSYVFACGNKTQAESMKKLYDQVAGGRPAVFADKRLFTNTGDLAVQLFEQNVKNNFIAPDIFDCLQNLENQFCTAIGLNNANTDKKERMIVDEVNANNQKIRSRAGLWLDFLQKSCDKVNNMFGINISVDWRESDAANSNTVFSGSLDGR